MKKLILSLILALGIAQVGQAGVPAPDIGSFDIVGIKQGMSPTEVLAILNSTMSSPKIAETRLVIDGMAEGQSFVGGLTGSAYPDVDIGVVFSAPPNPEQVIAIGRKSRYGYDGSARPTPENILSAIEQKYGAPTDRIDQSFKHILFWIADMEGQGLTNKGSQGGRACSVANSLGHGTIVNPQGANTNIILREGLAADGCAGLYMVSLVLDRRDGMVSEVNQYILYVDAHRKALSRTVPMIDAHQQAEAKKQQQASDSVKPVF